MDKNNKKSIENQLKKAVEKINKLSPLVTKKAQDFVDESKNLPDLSRLFGTFWQSGELTLLAGDTGIGKSLLAVEILDNISSGKSKLLDQDIDSHDLVVAYFDFELSDLQFSKRYRNHQFNSKFFRSRFNYNCENAELFSIRNLLDKVREIGAEAIVLDNISSTSLRPTQETDVALELMRELKKLTLEGISCLAIAHTPKFSNIGSLEINHMAGSKVLANFADSIFFINRSKENFSYRYLKQVKARNSEQMEDVIVCSIEETNGNLGFKFIRYDDESNHLYSHKDKDRETIKEEVLSLKTEGKSVREIAKILGISRSKTQRLLKE